MSSCECLPAFRAAIVRAAHYDKLLTFRENRQCMAFIRINLDHQLFTTTPTDFG